MSEDAAGLPPGPAEEAPTAAEADAYKEMVRQGEGELVEELGRTGSDLDRREQEGDIRLKRIYGGVLLLVLVSQVVAADYMFFRYARDGRNWDVDPVVMQAWLAATVIEVIGITAIVVRHLYPSREDPRPERRTWRPFRRSGEKRGAGGG